jgi:phosphatidylglycerol:prolipoprotein diacylglycerol transferase
MQAAIPFPDISPEIFTIPIFGMEFSLRWYALAYIAALLVGWWIVARLVSRPRLWRADRPPAGKTQLDELLTYAILGIILGGRLGYVLFYQPAYYLANPGEIVAVWKGGMAFHGGVIGLTLAGILFAWRRAVPMRSLADAIAVAAPAGLFFGRLANFINAELWGRPTDAPWGVIFPGEAAQACGPDWPAPCARHPSQLYEAGLEGVLLGLVLFLLVSRGLLKRPGFVAGVFLLGYGLARGFVEFFRQADAFYISPDNPLGHVIRFSDTLGLSMGQALSLPMIAIGLLLILLAPRRA